MNNVGEFVRIKPLDELKKEALARDYNLANSFLIKAGKDAAIIDKFITPDCDIYSLDIDRGKNTWYDWMFDSYGLSNSVINTKTKDTVESFDTRVNHPPHYTWLKEECGIEVIDLVRLFDFDIGNALKYILRAGHKKELGLTEKKKMIEDYKKAIWYLNDKINILSK